MHTRETIFTEKITGLESVEIREYHHDKDKPTCTILRYSSGKVCTVKIDEAKAPEYIDRLKRCFDIYPLFPDKELSELTSKEKIEIAELLHISTYSGMVPNYETQIENLFNSQFRNGLSFDLACKLIQYLQRKGYKLPK